MKKALTVISVLVIIFALQAGAAQATPRIDAKLTQLVNSSPLARTPVVITYDHQPSIVDFNALKALGLKGGVYLDHLPMVMTTVNKAQLNALSTRSDIRSLYANRKLDLFDDKSRPFIGVTALRADREVTTANNALPVFGTGVGVAYVDTGIDATHPDLQLGKNVAGNVSFPLAEATVIENPVGDFLPVVAVENAPLSDVEGGHGTFGAGITGGTGQASGTFYGGIAPGAKLLGLVAGNDGGLTSFGILQAFNYALANQFRYNIRVCNNSWGGSLADGPFDANDPINVATLNMHDHNITVVFAAGNGVHNSGVGDAPGAINPYCTAPWTICVAAADKEGLGNPAGFSSRGEDNGTGSDTAGAPETRTELPPPNLRPDITGSGVNIKSTRSKAPGETNLAGTVPYLNNDVFTIPPGFLPYYTTSQGTSFSTPQLSGVVALMMEANPLLTPDQVVTIIRQTATPMPYPERVVGAGYVDARNAVRAAMGLAAVNHPANLFRQPGDPEIIDPSNDASGNASQDIRTARFQYDPAQGGRLVYTLSVTDFSARQPENIWTLSSNFTIVPDPANPNITVKTNIFVSAGVSETGALGFRAGKIAPDPNTGVNTQTSISGSGVTGEIQGNLLIIRLPLASVNKAVFGVDALGNPRGTVLGMTSTGTDVKAQQQVGTSVSGGLLLAADTAGGADFVVGP
jgi:serine protease AprX